MSILLCNSLSIGTCWSFLRSAWSKTIVIVLTRTETTLSSLVSLLSVGSLTTWHCLSASHHIARWRDSVVLVHLIIKGGCPDRTAGLENAELLLIEYLRVGEALVGIGLSKMRWAHHLLGHHQVIRLRPIYSLLTLDSSNSKLGILKSAAANLSNCTYTTNSGRHLAPLSSELLDCPWSIWAIFSWNFWTVALQSNHSSTDTDDRIITNRSLAIWKVLVAASCDSSLVALIG